MQMITEHFESKSILLVEDNKQVRQAIAMALSMDGFHVHEANHGQEGLDFLKISIPNLILADIKMPVMNGLDFLKEVRKNRVWSQIPFIFLSANNSDEYIQAGRDLGVEDYLTKPIDSDQLLRIINARLVRSAELRAAIMDQAFLEMIDVLAKTIESRDPYTSGHIDRVARYANWFGKEMGWSESTLRVVNLGARLHDIGKIIVPDQVLKKKGPLTPGEWLQMKKHPVEGVKIIRGVTLLKSATPYILFHHEKWDGSGYPIGLKGKKIPIEGRMLALVDVFDALTNERPYRNAISFDEAIHFVEEQSGNHFDPNLTPIFVRLMRKKLGHLQKGKITTAELISRHTE